MYDGTYVESHCPECGEYESECFCDEGYPDDEDGQEVRD